MLNEADKKSIYDKLVYGDILHYLNNESLNFDVFIAADVFVYLGDLSEIFRLLKLKNQTAGKLIFSTEYYEGSAYKLNTSGRYSHSHQYIKDLCHKFKFFLKHFETCKLRKEKNSYVIGGLYFLSF